MGDPNLFISNGTCFSGRGQRASRTMIPCGNTVIGDLTCCQQGDLCLSGRACFNSAFGVTYLAGCTDPRYQDASCPNKGRFRDEPWVGLAYCNGTSNEWFACAQSRSTNTLTSGDPCFCPPEPRTIAFSASSTLQGRVRLGTSLGESLVFFPGHVPTIPTSGRSDEDNDDKPATPTTTIITTAPPPPVSPPETSLSSASTPPVETSASATDSDDDPALPSTSRIGIGLGVGVGSTVLLLVSVLLWTACRRRKRRRTAANLRSAGLEDKGASSSDDASTCAAPNYNTGNADGNHGRPGRGHGYHNYKNLQISTAAPPLPRPAQRYGSENHAEQARPISEIDGHEIRPRSTRGGDFPFSPVTPATPATARTFAELMVSPIEEEADVPAPLRIPSRRGTSKSHIQGGRASRANTNTAGYRPRASTVGSVGTAGSGVYAAQYDVLVRDDNHNWRWTSRRPLGPMPELPA